MRAATVYCFDEAAPRVKAQLQSECISRGAERNAFRRTESPAGRNRRSERPHRREYHRESGVFMAFRSLALPTSHTDEDNPEHGGSNDDDDQTPSYASTSSSTCR